MKTIEDLKKVTEFFENDNPIRAYFSNCKGEWFDSDHKEISKPEILTLWNQNVIYTIKDFNDSVNHPYKKSMSEARFDQIVDEVCEQIKNTLQVKAKEYRRNNNVFHNFDMGSQRSGLIREKVIDGFMLKHEVSISDMTNDLEKDILPTKSVLDEKFGDNIIYLIIKKASIIDKIERLVNIKTQ
ncbi:MAG: hypothetical protein KA270_02745 [Saprospiraceae bacterium]|nr:hypothetical protein [Saprospiraceae bacterium]